MAITTIGGSINSTAVLPNLDYKYGPYNSLQEAYDALGPEGADKLVVGLTVGIIQQGGGIVEYWFKDGTNFEDLVMKIGGSNEVDYQGLINKPSINSVVLSGNKTASDLDLYTKPATGIPSTDLSSAVQTSLGKADISVSNTVNDLVNYYLKTETYTQTEVNNLIGAIHQFHFEVYQSLQDITSPSSNVLYLIGPSSGSTSSDLYEEYVYANNNFVKIGDTSIDLSGYVTTTDLNTALAAYTTTTDLQTYYAQKDGEYNELHSGYTKWIEGNNSITDSDVLFTYRPSHNNFITQYGVIEALKGNSIAWNQLANPSVATSKTVSGVTVTRSGQGYVLSGQSSQWDTNTCFSDIPKTTDHKYMLYCNNWEGAGQTGWAIRDSQTSQNYYENIILTGSANRFTIGFAAAANYEFSNNEPVRYVCVFDLTLMFGAGNEPTVAQFEAWLASNIGLRDYYPYNAGTIINSKFQGLKTIGFNRFNIVNNTARLPIATDGNLTNGTQCYQITGSYTALEDEDGNAITPNSAGFFNISKAQIITISGGDATTCVHLTWSGDKNGEYEEYWTETKEFDVTKIYGKLNGEGELVQVFPEGMKSALDAKNRIYLDNGVALAMVSVASYDLGSMSWNDYTDQTTSSSLLPNVKVVGRTDVPNILCANYITSNYRDIANGCITLHHTSGYVWIKDTRLENKTGAEIKALLNNVLLNYELATPLTYTNLVYRDNGTDTSLVLPFNYRVDDYGSEEQLMPTPVNDEITSCACYLDLEYDIVRGIDFIKDTSDRLSDIDNNIQDLRVPVISQVPVSGMLPNVVYNLGTLGSNTTFTLATPTDNTILNHWYWTFNIGSTIPTIVWPSGIIWAGDNLSPIIEANKHYEISVINNIGTYIYSVVI